MLCGKRLRSTNVLLGILIFSLAVIIGIIALFPSVVLFSTGYGYGDATDGSLSAREGGNVMDGHKGGTLPLNVSNNSGSIVSKSSFGEFTFTSTDLVVVPHVPIDRVTRSEHGLLGAERSGGAYHANLGAWIPNFPTCDSCEEDCVGKHLAFYEVAGGWQRLLAVADAEIVDRRAFYNSPNWSDPDYGSRRGTPIKSNYSNDNGEEMFTALFGQRLTAESTAYRVEDLGGDGSLLTSGGNGGIVETDNELTQARRYVAKKLQLLADDMFMPWEMSGGVDDNRQVNMVTCSFVTRMRWNSFGIWVHIAGNNATILRQQVDALGRTVRVTRYIKQLVASGPPFLKPLVVYINVMDFPCNVIHPYLNFFTKRGVKGILFPDDQAVLWGNRRAKIRSAAKLRPFGDRSNSVFFIGSPNNKVRMDLRDMLQTSEYGNQTDITIAVLEHKMFKHLLRPIEYHTNYRYLLSVRGRTASSRDMSFQIMNSTVVRLDDHDTWFQWYHVLWEPYYHYLPLHPDNTTQQMCSIRRMFGPPEHIENGLRSNLSLSSSSDSSFRKRQTNAASSLKMHFRAKGGGYAANERLAHNMALLGEALTQETVDNYARYILSRFANMQTYSVDPNPVMYLKRMRSFVSKKHRDVQVIPDDSSHVKYVFWRWLARRWKQVLSCRDPQFAKATNGTRKSCTYL